MKERKGKLRESLGTKVGNRIDTISPEDIMILRDESKHQIDMVCPDGELIETRILTLDPGYELRAESHIARVVDHWEQYIDRSWMVMIHMVLRF